MMVGQLWDTVTHLATVLQRFTFETLGALDFMAFFKHVLPFMSKKNRFHFFFGNCDLEKQRFTASRRPNELRKVDLRKTADISVPVAQIKIFKKQTAFFFNFGFQTAQPQPIQLVPNQFNWYPNTVLANISVPVLK